MKRWALLATWIVLLTMITQPINALELEDLISRYTSETNGEGYLQPLADAFGANLNSGLFQTAKIHQLGLNIKFGAVGMLAPIGEDRKTFSASTEWDSGEQQTIEAPTVFGETSTASATRSDSTEYEFPAGLGVDRFPLVVPQLTVGSIRGTEATLRYFQMTVGKGVGDVKLFGFGVRHSISQYLKKPPLDLAASFFFQTFDVGDIVSAKTTYFGLQGSVERGPLTIYGGPALETSSLDISYTSDTNTAVDFNMDGSNSFRFTIGAALNILILRANIDYNIASQSTFSFGLGLGSVL